MSQNDPLTLDVDDEKPSDEKEFHGATLQIGTNESETSGAGIEVEFAPKPPDQRSTHNDTNSASMANENDTGISRNRPGSQIGRQSVRSTSSRTSLRPGRIQPDMAARSFYCYKESHFDKAVADCKDIIKADLDGEIKSTWLLTEIDHWDLEREKIIFLTDHSLIIVKYNFINERLYEFKRIMLHIIKTIFIGDFCYPNSSLMPERKHGGIQIRWDGGQELSFGQKWNPWCADIPWVTLSHHPLIYNPKETETTTYNVDEFFESLVTATSKVFADKRPGETLKVVEGPVMIESYANAASLVFNQSGIGFNRDRNGVSF